MTGLGDNANNSMEEDGWQPVTELEGYSHMGDSIGWRDLAMSYDHQMYLIDSQRVIATTISDITDELSALKARQMK